MADENMKLRALLELERRGSLTPPAAQLLAAYRAQGITKTKPLSLSGAALPANPQRLELQKSRDEARKQLALMDRIQPQLDRVHQLYDRGIKGAGPIKSLREYLPSQANSQFDRAVDNLAVLVRPTTRTSGEGAMSDFESKLALKPLPNRWSMDGGNEEALQGLQSFIDQSRGGYAKMVGLPAAPPRPRTKPTGSWDIQEER